MANKKDNKDVMDSKMTKQENKNSVKKEKKSSFKDFKTELKKVTWPTPKELVNKTIAVIVSVLIVALIVFVFDLVFENVYNYGTGALKNAIVDTESVSDTVDVQDTTGTEVTFDTADSAE